MSGIAGFVRTDGRGSVEHLEAMDGALAHLGGDGGGRWYRDDAGLSHLMRWTTPESLVERQPATGRSGVVLTADARLDNRSELIRLLEPAPATDRTVTDVALLVAAFERWGPACTDRLVGDFAFAAWDPTRRCLFAATDPMGARPLYYAHTPAVFAFASDPAALVPVPGVEERLDERGFYLRACGLRRLDPSRTCLAGVACLTGGRALAVEQGRLRVWDHWRFEPEPLTFADPRQCVEAFRAVLDEAVACRTRSAFAVGTLLSGGLDSSTVSALATRSAGPAGLHAFGACLPPGAGGPADERPEMDLVAGSAGLTLHHVVPDRGPADFVDGPFAAMTGPVRANPHIYSALHGAARDRGVRVLLDGLAGEWGPTCPAPGYLDWLARRGRWRHLARSVDRLARVQGCSPAGLVAREVVGPLLPGPAARMVRRLRGTGRPAVMFPLVAAWRDQVAGPGEPRTSGLAARRLEHQRIETVVTGRFPRDGCSRALGIVTCYPFLDVRVVRFCGGLSPDWFVRDGWRRWLVREAMAGVLPEAIRWRRDKRPFSPDYHERLRAGSPRYRQVLRSVGPADPVRDRIDVDRVARAVDLLDRRGSWAPGPGGDVARVVVDHGVQAIGFLRWLTARPG